MTVDCNYCEDSFWMSPVDPDWGSFAKHLRDAHPDVWDSDPALRAASTEWILE